MRQTMQAERTREKERERQKGRKKELLKQNAQTSTWDLLLAYKKKKQQKMCAYNTKRKIHHEIDLHEFHVKFEWIYWIQMQTNRIVLVHDWIKKTIEDTKVKHISEYYF